MIFLTEQEYKLIRSLAWDVLIDAGISELPVNIKAVASVYGAESVVDDSAPVYDNTVKVSEYILNVFGLDTRTLTEAFTVRLLAPMIVLKRLSVRSAAEVSRLTGLPPVLAEKRFERLMLLEKRNAFGISKLENTVWLQFEKWAEKYPH